MTTSAPEPDCLFCLIVAGEVPATIVARTENVVAFEDINPSAPMHVLVVPTVHHGDVSQLAAAAPDVLAELVGVAEQVAGEQADGQFRLIFNSGPHAGQTVFHVHAHVLGGTRLGALVG